MNHKNDSTHFYVYYKSIPKLTSLIIAYTYILKYYTIHILMNLNMVMKIYDSIC